MGEEMPSKDLPPLYSRREAAKKMALVGGAAAVLIYTGYRKLESASTERTQSSKPTPESNPDQSKTEADEGPDGDFDRLLNDHDFYMFYAANFPQGVTEEMNILTRNGLGAAGVKENLTDEQENFYKNTLRVFEDLRNFEEDNDPDHLIDAYLATLNSQFDTDFFNYNKSKLSNEQISALHGFLEDDKNQFIFLQPQHIVHAQLASILGYDNLQLKQPESIEQKEKLDKFMDMEMSGLQEGLFKLSGENVDSLIDSAKLAHYLKEQYHSGANAGEMEFVYKKIKKFNWDAAYGHLPPEESEALNELYGRLKVNRDLVEGVKFEDLEHNVKQIAAQKLLTNDPKSKDVDWLNDQLGKLGNGKLTPEEVYDHFSEE